MARRERRIAASKLEFVAGTSHELRTQLTVLSTLMTIDRRTQQTSRGALALVLTLLWSVPTSGQSADVSAWTEVRSEHFRVLGNESPQAVEAVAVAAERMLAVLDGFAADPEALETPPITFYAFGSTESYRMLGRIQSGSGVLFPHQHGVYAAFVTGLEPTRQVYRQVVHHLMEARFPAVPEWFRQGVAELYSNMEFGDGEVLIGKPIENYLNFLRLPANQSPQSRLFEPLIPELYGDLTELSVRSWALVHYLTFGDPDLRPRVDVYLSLLADLERPTRAFQQAFGMTSEELSRRVDVYIQNPELPFGRLPIETLEAVETRSRPLTRSEALLAFAELSLHAGADSAGRTVDVLRDLARPPTASAAVWTALGEAELSLGNSQDATEALKRAIEIEPDRFKAHLLLGESLVETVQAAGRSARNEDIEAAISTLERVVALQPESLAAWGSLGVVYASVAKPDARAIEVGSRAIELQPGRTDLVYNLLLMHAKRGETDDVRRLLTRLAALGGSEGQITAGREMLLQLMLKGTRQLMQAGRFEDAVGVLTEVQGRTTSEQLRSTAVDWMQQVQNIQQYNEFVELYNRAVRAYNDDRFDDALAALDSLAPLARPGDQKKTLERLRAEVVYWSE